MQLTTKIALGTITHFTMRGSSWKKALISGADICDSGLAIGRELYCRQAIDWPLFTTCRCIVDLPCAVWPLEWRLSPGLSHAFHIALLLLLFECNLYCWVTLPLSGTCSETVVLASNKLNSLHKQDWIRACCPCRSSASWSA